MKFLSYFLTFSIILLSSFSMSGCKKEGKAVVPPSETQSHNSSEASSVNSSAPPSSAVESSSEVSSDIPVVATLIDTGAVTMPDLSQYENEKKGWGQGLRVDDKNRPVSANEYQVKYGEYGGLFIMPADNPNMYLTFDEGYENGYTGKILDTLKEKDCKAVFFVTMDYVKSQPELVKRMIDEGHTVGNHSVHHKSMPTLDAQTAVEEITGLHNYMVENYNYQMTLFRPPMGEYSTRTLAMAQALGYKTVLWSYAYLDYDPKKQMGVDAAFPKVSNAAHNGAIYLLHAVSKDNTEMLGDLIDYWREKEFTLANPSNLSSLDSPSSSSSGSSLASSSDSSTAID